MAAQWLQCTHQTLYPVSIIEISDCHVWCKRVATWQPVSSMCMHDPVSSQYKRSVYSPCCQDGVLGAHPMDGSVFQTQRGHAATLPILHNQIQGKVFNEVVAIVAQRLKITRGINQA